MTLEVRTLHYLVTVAEAGSVNAAAQRLRLTSPSLARQLQRLERRLGLRLLTVRAGRTVLTEAGRRFLPYAEDLLLAVRTAEEAAAQLAQSQPVEEPSTT